MWKFIVSLFNKMFVPKPASWGKIPDSVFVEVEEKPFVKRVGAIVFNPFLKNGKSLIGAMGYNDPVRLMDMYSKELFELSNGLATYSFSYVKFVSSIPMKSDGFQYKADDLEQVLAHRGLGAHHPDEADYDLMLRETGALQNIIDNVIDEVWLFGPPYGGFYESRECGSSPRFVNSPGLGLLGVRNFIVMGFNYEREVGEMLEDFGHRAESMLFMQPGFAEWTKEHGTVHRLPADTEDYQWQGMGILKHHQQWLSAIKPEWWKIIR